VVGGQVEDLAAAGQGADAARVAFIHRHKTADLFRAAVRMGGLAGGATAGQLECLSVYGVNVGLAFQISDDLLDASAGDPQELTCLSVYTPAEARARAEALIEKAVGALRALPGPVEPLEAIARFVTVRVE
jgi:geranylgeranyl pyrophosphate synthase